MVDARPFTVSARARLPHAWRRVWTAPPTAPPFPAWPPRTTTVPAHTACKFCFRSPKDQIPLCSLAPLCEEFAKKPCVTWSLQLVTYKKKALICPFFNLFLSKIFFFTQTKDLLVLWHKTFGQIHDLESAVLTTWYCCVCSASGCPHAGKKSRGLDSSGLLSRGLDSAALRKTYQSIKIHVVSKVQREYWVIPFFWTIQITTRNASVVWFGYDSYFLLAGEGVGHPFPSLSTYHNRIEKWGILL